jgi:hypothetical protein
LIDRSRRFRRLQAITACMARVREIEIHEKSFLKIRDVRTGVIVSDFSEVG